MTSAKHSLFCLITQKDTLEIFSYLLVLEQNGYISLCIVLTQAVFPWTWGEFRRLGMSASLETVLIEGFPVFMIENAQVIKICNGKQILS